MRRYVATLFRLKELFLIPIITVPAIALIVTFYTSRQYTVEAKVWVEPSTFLGNLDDRGSRDLTPSSLETNTFNEWLSTESFRMEVISRSGLKQAVDEGLWPVPSELGEMVAEVPVVSSIANAMGIVTPVSRDKASDLALDMVEKQLAVSSDGTNLLTVSYVGAEPFLGKRLVEESIIFFNEKATERQLQESELGIAFYSLQADNQKTQLEAAEEAERAFLEQYPEPLPGQTRPAVELAELNRLRGEVALARGIYEDALRTLRDVQIQADAAISSRNDSFSVVDLPEVPDQAGIPSSTLLLNLIVGLTLGGMITGAGVIAITWTDGTVRTREDLEESISIPLVEQVPLVSGFSEKRNLSVRSAFAGVLAPTRDAPAV